MRLCRERIPTVMHEEPKKLAILHLCYKHIGPNIFQFARAHLSLNL